MTKYLNLSRRSNVEAYAIYPDKIVVKFYDTTKLYQYSYYRAGKHYVDIMKQLANRGYGLNSFINRYCKYLYDR